MKNSQKLKVPPSSIDTEKSLLCSMIIDSSIIDSIIPTLSVWDFYDIHNAKIYNAIVELKKRDSVVDFITVKERLESSWELEEIGWVSYLIDITSSVYTSVHSIEYANIIKQKSWLRKLISLWNKITSLWYNDDAEVWDIVDEYKKIAMEVEDIKVVKDDKKNSVKSILFEVEDSIITNKDKEWILWYSTWLPTLDKFTEGLQPWTVMTINAYANTGKSKLAYHMVNSFLRQGLSVSIISLEVTKKTVLLNLLTNWYNENYYDLAKGRKLIDFSSYYDHKLEIVDTLYKLKDILNYIEYKKPDVVVIDFVQNISAWWATIYDSMREVAVALQLMSIKTGCATLCLSQISNEGANSFKRWWIIPSKWGWELVASTDVGLVLRKVWEEKNKLSLNIAKNKFWFNDIEIILETNFARNQIRDLGEDIPTEIQT